MTARLTLAAGAFALATFAGAAQAGVLFSMPGSTGPMAVDTSYAVNFNGPAGEANLSFSLNGYASLDGQNWYEDDFTLSLNGAEIFKGTFNLGGGGNDVVFFQPTGATVDNISGNGTNVTWAGGTVNIAAPINLIAGENTLTFAYHALTTDHAGWQDMGDESWGVSNIQVTSGAVPEPATWGLMIMGFGSLGVMFRRQRRLALAPIRV